MGVLPTPGLSFLLSKTSLETSLQTHRRPASRVILSPVGLVVKATNSTTRISEQWPHVTPEAGPEIAHLSTLVLNYVFAYVCWEGGRGGTGDHPSAWDSDFPGISPLLGLVFQNR